MGRGNVAKAAGRVGADELVTDGGSFELQLDTPNAARSPSEITVHAARSGVQNLDLLTSFFLSAIAITSNFLSTDYADCIRICVICGWASLLLAKPERVKHDRHFTALAHVLD